MTEWERDAWLMADCLARAEVDPLERLIEEARRIDAKAAAERVARAAWVEPETTDGADVNGVPW